MHPFRVIVGMKISSALAVSNRD